MPDRPTKNATWSGRPLSRRELLRASVRCAGAACLAAWAGAGQTGHARPSGGLPTPTWPSPWFEPLAGDAVRCTLCPHACRLTPGQRGRCRVRENVAGELATLAYGNPALVQVHPVERTPFFHWRPAARALSVATAGCPLACDFCEVWDMALVDPEEVVAYDLPPAALFDHARDSEVQALAFAFGEPVASFEYFTDAAALARDAGMGVLAHTSGYLSEAPLAALAGMVDAVNVDLKGFDDGFYRDLVGGELAPVLRALTHLRDAGVHLEITHLVIPTLNDDAAQTRAMCDWIVSELGPDVPLHLARFYPLYRLANLPPTPVSSLDRARAIAFEAGLRHVYVARVTGHEGENTFCPHCAETVVARLGFFVEEVALQDGRCVTCGGEVAGRWA
jgi:pyruvate formate lyase activating enzyme